MATKTDYTQEQITQALLAVVAWAGNVRAALRDLEDRDPPLFIPERTLYQWVKEIHEAQYNRLRDEYAAELEKRLAHEYRDVAAKAVQVQDLALQRAHERLQENRDAEPAKTASFAARAGGTAVEKLMTLTNRPERITEQRDINQVLRSLAGRGVLQVIQGTAEELPEGEKPQDEKPAA